MEAVSYSGYKCGTLWATLSWRRKVSRGGGVVTDSKVPESTGR
jgi:hypothetical protein